MISPLRRLLPDIDPRPFAVPLAGEGDTFGLVFENDVKIATACEPGSAGGDDALIGGTVGGTCLWILEQHAAYAEFPPEIDNPLARILPARRAVPMLRHGEIDDHFCGLAQALAFIVKRLRARRYAGDVFGIAERFAGIHGLQEAGDFHHRVVEKRSRESAFDDALRLRANPALDLGFAAVNELPPLIVAIRHATGARADDRAGDLVIALLDRKTSACPGHADRAPTRRAESRGSCRHLRADNHEARQRVYRR